MLRCFFWLGLFVLFGGVVLFGAEQVLRYSSSADSDKLKTMKVSLFSGKSPANSSLEVRTYDVVYAKVDEVSTMLKSLMPDIDVGHYEDKRLLVIQADPGQHQSIEAILQQLDSPSPQIKLDVQVIEVATDKFEVFRSVFEALSPGFLINYSFDKGKLHSQPNLPVVLLDLVQTGKAELLAQPSVTTLDQERAYIQIGDSIPYVTSLIHDDTKVEQIEQVEVGIKLDILPQVTSTNYVALDIMSEVSSIKLWKQFNASDFPVIAQRKAKTNVVIKSGETLVIAGLLDEKKIITKTKIPILGDIPLLGWLFRGKRTDVVSNDLLFLITPIINQM